MQLHYSLFHRATYCCLTQIFKPRGFPQSFDPPQMTKTGKDRRLVCGAKGNAPSICLISITESVASNNDVAKSLCKRNKFFLDP